jgi:hypothetical protein
MSMLFAALAFIVLTFRGPINLKYEEKTNVFCINLGLKHRFKIYQELNTSRISLETFVKQICSNKIESTMKSRGLHPKKSNIIKDDEERRE